MIDRGDRGDRSDRCCGTLRPLILRQFDIHYWSGQCQWTEATEVTEVVMDVTVTDVAA